jgi:hypothetical protein
LTVIFQQASEFLLQERHAAMGALFVPAPEPLPEPFAELVLRIESPTNAVAELRVRAVQMSEKGVALAFADAAGARAALAPLFAEARGSGGGEGATWVFWGRPEPVADAPGFEAPSVSEGPAEPESASADGLLYDQIRAMGTQEKIRLALHGDRAARLFLIKDVNKTIQTFLLQNPRITIDEVRYIAGFRQASPDALQTIAAHREWGQNPNVVAALVRNPKTPSTVAVKLLDKLAPAEIRRLAKSAEVPRAVQAAARKRATE